MMTPTEEHYEKLLAEVNRESEKYNGMHQIAVMEIERLREVLTETERFMAYFAGETGGHFVGGGAPKTCLEQIRKVLPDPVSESRKP